MLKRPRRFDWRERGNRHGMTDRGMADDSSEQVPGQQSNESSREDIAGHGEPRETEGLGQGPHAGEGDTD